MTVHNEYNSTTQKYKIPNIFFQVVYGRKAQITTTCQQSYETLDNNTERSATCHRFGSEYYRVKFGLGLEYAHIGLPSFFPTVNWC